MNPTTNACEAEASLGNGKFRYDSQPVWGLRDDRVHCSWCGSMSPEAVIAALKTPGTHFSGSDWKYSWPHKFYIDVPNPKAEELVDVGSRSGPDVTAATPGAVFVPCRHLGCVGCNESYWKLPTMGTRSTLSFKFYNKHIKDMTPEQLAEFIPLADAAFGILFDLDPEKGLGYRSVPGIQMWGRIGPDGKPDHSDMRP